MQNTEYRIRPSNLQVGHEWSYNAAAASSDRSARVTKMKWFEGCELSEMFDHQENGKKVVCAI